MSEPRAVHIPSIISLCESCAHRRVVTTPRGSRFLLCRKSAADPRFPKYPPQPVVRCHGYEPAIDERNAAES